MDKLFRYAKIAAIITIVSAALFALLQLVGIFTGNNWSFFSLVLNVVEFATIAVFGSLICKFSAKGSPLRIPAMIGIITAAIGIAISIIYAPSYGPYIYTGKVMIRICAIGFSICFIWLSKYFNDKKIKQLCIAYPVFYALILIFRFTFIEAIFHYYEAYNSYVVICILLATLRMITLSAFYHMFYKMSTK